jgi:hypothetical protein
MQQVQAQVQLQQALELVGEAKQSLLAVALVLLA